MNDMILLECVESNRTNSSCETSLFGGGDCGSKESFPFAIEWKVSPTFRWLFPSSAPEHVLR